MTRRLGNPPAPTAAFPNLQFKFVDKLFADKSFCIDLYADADADADADAEARVRAAVDTTAPKAAGEATALGSGGATVPHRGNGVSTLPPQIAKASIPGSSTVKRWNLLSKIQRLCRPTEEGARGPAVVGCGMPGHDATSVNIHLRTAAETGEIRAGVSGIYRCGSPWLCPVCATKKAHDRAERVQAAANATFQRGGRAALVVLTASHSLDMSLAEIKGLVGGASSAARKGRSWTKAVRDYGVLGVVVGQEATYSVANGWHYHQHLSVMVDGPDGEDSEFYVFPDAYIPRRQRRRCLGLVFVAAGDLPRHAALGCVIAGVGGILRHPDVPAVSVRNLAPFVADLLGIGPSDPSAGRFGTLIAIAAADGDGAMLGRWREYMETMPGTRSCVVSAALAKRLDIALVDDGEGGEQVLHDADEVVGRVEAPMWRVWMRHGLAATFLSRVEFGGQEGRG